MGASVECEPIVFLKPSSSLIINPEIITLPNFSKNIHHEVELVFEIGKNAYLVKKSDADKYISGYGIGVDLTARDIQSKAKEKGHPWSSAKGFYQSAPCSDITSKIEYSSSSFNLEIKVNGEIRQTGNTDDMIWSIPELLEFLSSRFYLNKGDLVFTGTPSGVSQIVSGDRVEAYLNSLKKLDFKVL